jgi:CRISPR locus-related DNA-binding protein
MVVVFGTLGFTSEPIISSIVHLGNVEKVVAFCSSLRHERVTEAHESLKKFCALAKLPVSIVELKTHTDMVSIMKIYRRELLKIRGKDVVFDITAGSKIMSGAALLICNLEGMRALYHDEETETILECPIITMKMKEMLTPVQKRILQHLDSTGETSQQELSDHFKRAKSTMHAHLRSLVDRNLISIRPEGKRNLVMLKPAAQLILQEE